MPFVLRFFARRSSRRCGALLSGAVTLGWILASSGFLGVAHASGFVLYDQSAAALAQGSAVVGNVSEPAANWFNPAGLAFAPAAAGSATLSLAIANTRFAPPSGTPVRSDLAPQVVPNAFVSLPVSARATLGLGVFAPYGFAVNWPSAWAGREKAISVRVAVVAANLNFAWRFSDRLAGAVGVAPLYGRVAFAVGLPASVGSRGDLEGSDWDWQANAAVMWKLAPNRFHLGAAYRGLNTGGRSRLGLEGEANFTVTSASLAETFADQRARATLPLPDLASLGATFFPSRHWQVGLQIDYTRWSVFDRLEITFERPTTPRQIIERRSRDAASLRAGASFSGWRPGIELRAGLTFEQTTGRKESLAPSAPDGDRVGVSVGVGLMRQRYRVDFGYLLLALLPAEAAGGLEGPAGTYTTLAHVLGLTVTGVVTAPSPPAGSGSDAR